MIHLTTGLPGNGKTLYTIATVKERAEKENRRVFYSGIEQLQLGWEKLENPTKWHECPAGSIIVLDECQTVLPTRGQGAAVPGFVQAFSTHRHHGFDVYLITQDPMQFDHFVRRLVGVWWHLVRPFGLQYAQLWEFQKVGDFNDHFFRKDNGQKRRWDFPKSVFGLYHSAEVHTHKRRFPWRKFGGIGLLLGAIAACGFIAWTTLWGMGGDAAAKGDEVQKVIPKASPGVFGSAPRAKEVASPREYIRARIPRVREMPESAPLYDELAKPVAFPRVAACWSSAKGCTCYTQQGTVLAGVADWFCAAFVKAGQFDPYRPPEVAATLPAVPADRQSAPHGAEASGGGVLPHAAVEPPRTASSGPGELTGTARLFADRAAQAAKNP